MYRFTGMTRPVADFLANRVFCILDDPGDDSPRVTASEFGTWIKNLPALLGGNHGMHRTVSNSSTGHPIAPSTPLSHRPTSRNPSNSTRVSRTPALVARSLSRAPSLGPAYEREEASQLSTVYDHEEDEEQSQEAVPVPVLESVSQPILEEKEIEQEHGDNDPVSIKSASTKRRKRGLRKGKAATAAAAATASGTPTTTMDETLATLTIASQELAREISKASRVSSTKSASTKASTPSSARVRASYEPVLMFGMPKHLCTGSKNTPVSASSVPTSSTVPVPVKKSSIWKLSFGKQNVSVSTSTVASPVEEVLPDVGSTQSQTMSTTASNVTGLIMSLNAPTVSVAPSLPVLAGDHLSTWARGRCGRGSPTPSMKSSKSSANIRAPSSGSPHKSDAWSFGEKRPERGASPNSTRSGRSGRPLASSTCCSIASGNWRNSTSTSSSAGTSTSAFTRYSNSSNRSISTTATSVSSTSWRTGGKGLQSSASSTYSNYPALSKNVKGECCRSTHCIVLTDAYCSHVWCSVGTSAAASCSISE